MTSRSKRQSPRAAGLEQRTRRRQPNRPVCWRKPRARARFSGSARPTFGKPESRFLRQGLGEARIQANRNANRPPDFRETRKCFLREALSKTQLSSANTRLALIIFKGGNGNWIFLPFLAEARYLRHVPTLYWGLGA